MKGKIISILLVFSSIFTFAQQDIFQLLENQNTSLSEIKTKADVFFKVNGNGRGSGYKQYQRWLYERNFHSDANGYFISPLQEFQEYERAVSKMKSMNNLIKGTVSAVPLWTEQGPFHWNKTSGWNPGTGRLTAMAIHPLNENIIYVGSPGGGLWKTTNAGVNWTPLFDNNSSRMFIYSITIDPTDQNIVYVGTGNSVNQVLKSTDAGVTWSVIGSGPTGTIRKILIQPSNSNIVFACASNGIFRSINAGATWTQVQSVSKEDIEFKPNDENIMYATGTTEVVRSVNNGVSWTTLTATNGITATGRSLVAVSAANPDYVYVVQASGSLFGRMYKSTNGGLNFVTTITGSPASGTNFFGYETNGTGLTGQATYDMALCVSPLDAEEVHIAGIICWKSTNGGSTFVATTAWSLPNTIGYNHADVHGLDFVNNNIYSLSDGGIYKSTDFADNFTDLSNGLGIRQFYRIASSPTNATVVTGGAQDNGSVCKQVTGTWVDWLGADGMEGLVSPVNHLNLWGTSQNGQLYRSTNGGASRINLAAIPGGAWVTPIAIHPTNETILFAGGSGVYKSTNSGSSFSLISGSTISGTVADLAIAPSSANDIYASVGSTLYVSADGGITWVAKAGPGTITDICISPLNPLKIWITTSSGVSRVYVSTNSGSSFTDIQGILPVISARSIVVDNTSDERLFIGMNIGVYTRSNSNPAWLNYSDNLPLVAINELDIQHANNKLRVATYGRGIWEASSIIVSSCDTPTNLFANNITNSQADINWTAVAGAINYTVEYKLQSSGTWITATTAATAAPYNLTGLAPLSIYDYQVRTNCSGNNSAYAQAQFTTLPNPCDTPTNLFANNITNSQADINWTAVAGAINYTVEYKLQSSGTWITATTTATAAPFNLTGLLPLSTYDYQVRTNCSGNNSAYVQAQFTTLPNPCDTPTNLFANNITNSQADINWTAVAGAINYTVEYKLQSSGTWITATTTATAAPFNLTGLAPLNIYDYQVRTNCSGNNSAYVQAQFTTLPNPCDTPTNLFANNITNSQADINWTAVAGAINYTVEYKLQSSGTWITATTAATAAPFNLTGLFPLSIYDYQVRTNCSGNNSDYVQAQFTTSANPCGIPTGLFATNITDTGAIVNWSAVAGALSYRVQYKKNNTTTWLTVVLNTTSTSQTITGLLPNTTYKYKVRSKCASGNSAYIIASFKTLVAPQPLKIADAGNINTGNINLFPNPVNSRLTVSINDEKIVAITIYNLLGVEKLKVIDQHKSASVQLNVEDLESGVYFIKIYGDKEYISKFVKE